MSMVKEMEWKDAKELIERRLNKLALCKRGAINTDCNKQIEDLGPMPSYTKEEKETIKQGLYAKMAKKGNVTVAMLKKHKGDINSVMNEVIKKMRNVSNCAFIHPDAGAWERKRANIKRQEEERIATLDGDIQDTIDTFIIGQRDIKDFPAVYDELEQTEW